MLKRSDMFEAVAIAVAVVVLILDLFYWRGG